MSGLVENTLIYDIDNSFTYFGIVNYRRYEFFISRYGNYKSFDYIKFNPDLNTFSKLKEIMIHNFISFDLKQLSCRGNLLALGYFGNPYQIGIVQIKELSDE